MAKFLDKDRCEKLTKEEIERQEKEGLPIWNLLCHLVLQKSKYRFCHDARALVGGICPNELLIGDLNLMTPMLDPINNLRNNLYAFGTDIEGFFHNILVDVKDRGIFRFWFYKDEKMDELELIIFLAHIFGSSVSPTVCSFVLIEHAHQIRDMIS